MARRNRCSDPTKKENLKQVMPKIGEVYNGLVDHFSRKKQCKRMPGKIKSYPPKEEPNQQSLEGLIEEAMKRIEIREEIRRLLWEEEQEKLNKKCEPMEPIQYVKHPCKCESIYDWSYVKGHAGDAVSSPSFISLRSFENYLVLPRDVEKEMKKTERGNLHCDQDFIEYPRHDHRIVGKRLPPTQDLILKSKIDNLENKFKNWKKTKKLDYYSKIKKKTLSLIDKINLGHQPNLNCREDLISLFDKIKPRAPKMPNDILLACRDCYDFDDDRDKPRFFVPNNYRQLEVLSRYTPTDHQQIPLKKRENLGMKILEQKNKLYYGNGPTLWKCDRIGDTLLTEGPKNQYCRQTPCVCPEKPKRELKEVKKALDYPTFMALSISDRRNLKCSWKNRGISKSSLIMLWFDKLFRRDPDSLHLQMPGQSIEGMFLDEENLRYMDQLASILDLVMNCINKPDITTKLICEVGYIHSCLDVKETFFQTLKDTLLETVVENFYPKLKKEQVTSWKNFVDIMFDLIHNCFVWNKWPPSELRGTKELVELDEKIEDYLSPEDLTYDIEENTSITEKETISSGASIQYDDECQEIKGTGYANGEEEEEDFVMDSFEGSKSIKILKDLSITSNSSTN